MTKVRTALPKPILILRVAPRPPDWKGKLWAVASGIRAETSPPDFFLLTDADIEYVSAGIVAALIAKAEQGFDLVSVMVRLSTESAAEKFLIPAFVFFSSSCIRPRGWHRAASPLQPVAAC